MEIALLILIGVFLVTTAFSLAAAYEALQQVRDLRDLLNLHNDPVPLQLTHEARLAPELLPDSIGTLPEAMLLFLSNKCTNCISIAKAIDQAVPDRCWVVVEEVTAASSPIIARLIEANDRVLADTGGQLAGALGLATTPSVVKLAFGEIQSVFGISSVRHVELLAPRLEIA
jgi:hypothetical protein